MHSKKRQWHDRRVSSAKEIVSSELKVVWTNDVIGEDLATIFQRTASSADKNKNMLKLAFLNSAAPALIRAVHAKFAYEFLGAIVNEPSVDAMGLSLAPAHTHEKGQVYRMESIYNDTLASANLNIDRSWALSFDGHDDARDERPLLRMGRVLLPMNKPLKYSMWKHSNL